MSLNSFEFFLFFVPLLLLRLCVRSVNVDKWLLLAASLAFYLTWSWPGVLLILLASALGWAVGRRMEQTADPSARWRLLMTNVVANVALLAFFKYTNFFLENLAAALNAVGWHVRTLQYHIVTPPAISYFTFASMSYAIDVYYKRLPTCRSVRDYTLFMSFFPKLLSGPIERAIDFLPQLKERKQARLQDLETGLMQFLVGAVKKMAIADQMAGNVNLIFAAPAQFDSFTLWQGLLGYTVELYCDFSGYSDMAIGCARIMGFRFRENFQMPFSAVNISEYWRRWHISLSFWFRDYVFLPLQVFWLHWRTNIVPGWFRDGVLRPLEKATKGNLYPVLHASLSFVITMVLIGLWHGAGWGFVLCGLLHGLALSTHVAWTRWNPLAAWRNRGIYAWTGTLVSRVLTLSVVVFGMGLFRAPTVKDAFSYFRAMLSWRHHGTRLVSPYIVFGIAVVVLVHLFVKKDRNWALEIPSKPLAVRMAACTGLVLALAFFGSTDTVPFIYFQF